MNSAEKTIIPSAFNCTNSSLTITLTSEIRLANIVGSAHKHEQFNGTFEHQTNRSGEEDVPFGEEKHLLVEWKHIFP